MILVCVKEIDHIQLLSGSTISFDARSQGKGFPHGEKETRPSKIRCSRNLEKKKKKVGRINERKGQKQVLSAIYICRVFFLVCSPSVLSLFFQHAVFGNPFPCMHGGMYCQRILFVRLSTYFELHNVHELHAPLSALRPPRLLSCVLACLYALAARNPGADAESVGVSCGMAPGQSSLKVPYYDRKKTKKSYRYSNRGSNVPPVMLDNCSALGSTPEYLISLCPLPPPPLLNLPLPKYADTNEVGSYCVRH